MCGLLGAIGDGPLPTADEVRVALDALAHRGPDDLDVHAGEGCVLGATRLAIQGGAEGRQPVRSRDGRFTLAFNGEVLGRRRAALANLVGLGGAPATSDTRLLVEAAATLASGAGGLTGPAVLALLEGSMGALALHDQRRQEVWLARDRLGIKPLYVLAREDLTFFASEIRPLLRCLGGPPCLDEEGLAELVFFQRPVRTLPLRAIEALPPGACWRIPRRGRPTRWAGGTGIRDLVARDALEPPEALEALGRALEDAAREAADVEDGTVLFLSGGLDSAAVAAYAREARPRALTGRFAPVGGPEDESAAAAAVAGLHGLAHEVVDLADGDLLEDLPAVVAALEVPQAGPGALALWRLARRARALSRVVLTGTGGDELLGGYVRTALALGRAGPWTAGYEPLVARLEGAPVGSAERQRRLVDRSGDLLPLLASDLKERLPMVDPPGHLARHGLPAGLGASALVDDEVEGTLPMLLHVEDRVTMAHGLEGRPVFCLGDVPEAAARLPQDWLVGPDGETKRALRHVLRGLVPEEVRTDPVKRGFPTPFVRAARHAGRHAAEAVIEDGRFGARGWYDVAACRRALDEDRPTHDRALYALLSLELWARAFLDQPVRLVGARP